MPAVPSGTVVLPTNTAKTCKDDPTDFLKPAAKVDVFGVLHRSSPTWKKSALLGICLLVGMLVAVLPEEAGMDLDTLQKLQTLR